MLLPLLHQHRKLLTWEMEPLVHPKLLQQPMKQSKKHLVSLKNTFSQNYMLAHLV